jgi:hypothetical protein
MIKVDPSSIGIITATHSRDIEQFAILRRSIKLFAPAFAQTAIVNTEDYSEFRNRFGEDQGLQIVKTSQVLPRWVERHRRKSGPGWRSPKWLDRRRIKGWHAQQLMKIFALADCRHEAAVFIDSDVFICRPLEPSYFYIDGQLKLFRRVALNAESLDYDIATHEILGNALHQITELYDYVFSPCCFRKSSAVSLLAEFTRRKRSSWIRRFVQHTRPSEYNLLGYAATVVEKSAGYRLVECNPDELHHSIRFPEDRARLAAEIEQLRLAPKRFALIQSALGVPLEQIVKAFECAAAAHRGS